VSGTAIGGNGGGSNGPGGPGASVSLTSNGGVNDAVGGATSGTLNLTQTATGGSGRFNEDPSQALRFVWRISESTVGGGSGSGVLELVSTW
jgi:hypothetical protein